jgi:hypothetical protein
LAVVVKIEIILGSKESENLLIATYESFAEFAHRQKKPSTFL